MVCLSSNSRSNYASFGYLDRNAFRKRDNILACSIFQAGLFGMPKGDSLDRASIVFFLWDYKKKSVEIKNTLETTG